MDLRERAPGSGSDIRRHPWELTRARFFLRELTDSGVLRGASSALDAGSGDAFFAQELARAGVPRVVAWDAEYTTSSRAELGVSSASVELRSEAPEERFPLIVALDVLEHVDDDHAFLSALVERNLGNGGWLLISVPAWPALATEHDRQLHHHRRYTAAALRDLLAAAGLRELRGGGLFHSLILPRLAGVARDRLLRERPHGDLEPLRWTAGHLITRAVTLALELDNTVSRTAARSRTQLPGLSQWALCQRR